MGSAEFRRTGRNRDTTGERAKAGVVGSGIDARSRRIKSWTPRCELPGSKCGQSFHQDHDSGTFWTAETGGLSWSSSDQCKCMGPWVVQQQTLTEGQQCSSSAIGQETEGTDANKAAWQYVQQKTSQELLRGERHLPFLIPVRIILPAEGNLVMLESHKPVVGDGDTMGVAGEITQHMMRSAEGWPGIDDPVLPE